MTTTHCSRESCVQIIDALKLADQLRDMSTKFKTPSHEKGVCNGAIEKLRRLHEINQELIEALEGVLYWDNGKPEWETAKAVFAKAKEENT